MGAESLWAEQGRDYIGTWRLSHISLLEKKRDMRPALAASLALSRGRLSHDGLRRAGPSIHHVPHIQK